MIRTPGSLPDTTKNATSANPSNCIASCAKLISSLLKSLSPDQWKLYGQHSERGQESIEHIVRMIAGHDNNHFKQIESILNPTK